MLALVPVLAFLWLIGFYSEPLISMLDSRA